MKKALVLMILLIVLSVSGMVLVFTVTNNVRDQVEITAISKFGDASAAEGLEVLARTHYNRHLFWNTTYRTDTAAVQTGFLFSQTQIDENAPKEYSGVYMETGTQYGFDLRQEGKQSGIAAAYKELFDRTPAGTEATATLKLKDYYDFYPMGVTLDMPGNTLGWSEDYVADAAPEPGAEEYIIRAFEDFFRIPVIEDETIDISVTKNADGSTGGYGSGSTDSDAFYIRSLNALTDDVCYFTFNSHTGNGDVVDTSLIPGGYGIYCLPYSESGVVKNGVNISGILIDELSMVYSLNPEDTVFGLYTNPDKTKLLLLTKENNVCVLTVIDIEAMAPLQRLELESLGKGDNVWNTYYYDDFFALWLPENQLAVIDVNQNGEYEHRFTVELTDEANKLYYLNINAVMDWDGERLVVSDFLSNTYDRENINNSKYCSFYLAVYDETGLLYYGEYLSSLDAGGRLNDRNDLCQHIYYSPLSVRWID